MTTGRRDLGAATGAREAFKLKCRYLRNSLTGPSSRELEQMMELKDTTVFQTKLVDFFQCRVHHSRGPAVGLVSNVLPSW